MDSDVFSVKRILAERMRKGKKEYFVEWDVDGDNKPTWEPARNILDKSLIVDFQKSEKKDKKKKIIRKKHKERKKKFSKKEITEMMDDISVSMEEDPDSDHLWLPDPPGFQEALFKALAELEKLKK